jgi:ABC-type sugar transport system substrate-binding protein
MNTRLAAKLAGLLLLAAPVLDAQPAAGPEGGRKLRLGGIVLIDSPWGDAVARGMRLGAADAGAAIDLRRHYYRFDKERAYVNDLIADRIDALVLVPQVEEASGYLLRRAKEAGIPVVCVGICLTDRDNSRVVAGFYESDNYELGYRTGTYAAEWIGRHPELFPPDAEGRRTVELAFIHSDVYAVSYRRGQGFRQGLKDAGIAWREPVSLQGITVEEAMAAAQEIARSHPNIHLIWTDNSENTIGAVRGLDALPAEETRGLYLFGTDLNPDVAAALLDERNIVQAVTTQLTCRMARKATLAAVRYARGEGDGLFDHVILESRLFSRDDPDSVRPFLAKDADGRGAEPCD